MDGCVLLTSTPECVVSPRRAIPRAQPEGSPRGETTHEGVDVNNTHPSMINPDYNMILANLTLNYQYFACLLNANQSLNREQFPSALPCYHVILKTSIIAAPTSSSWNVKRVRFRGTRCWCVLSNYASTLDWCHLPGDDDALIMRCCLKASFLLHTALPNETG